MILKDPADAPTRPDSWTALPPDDSLIVWSLRHLLVCWPTCSSVEAALHERWSDEGVAILHLLRCWLTGLSMHAKRPFTVGDPTCAVLLADERALLALLHEPSAAGLAQLCRNGRAARLLPLVTDLARATGLSDESDWALQTGGMETVALH